MPALLLNDVDWQLNDAGVRFGGFVGHAYWRIFLACYLTSGGKSVDFPCLNRRVMTR